jgi:hypothetical protein
MSCSRWHHRGVGKYSFRPWAELAADVASGGLADLDAAVVEGVGVLSARPMSHSFPTWRGGRGRTIRPRFIHYIRPGRDHKPPSTNIPCGAGWKNASISSRNPQPQRPCAVIRHCRPVFASGSAGAHWFTRPPRRGRVPCLWSRRRKKNASWACRHRSQPVLACPGRRPSGSASAGCSHGCSHQIMAAGARSQWLRGGSHGCEQMAHSRSGCGILAAIPEP